MSLREQCTECSAPAGFFCSCNGNPQVFCEAHADQHLEQLGESSHIKQSLFVNCSRAECEAASAVLQQLEAWVMQQKKRVLERTQQQIHKLDQKLRKVTSDCSQAIAELTQACAAKASVLSSITATRMLPVVSQHPEMAKLIEWRSTHTELSLEAFSYLLPDSFAYNVQREHDLSCCLAEQSVQILTANMDQATIVSEGISMYSRCLAIDEDTVIVTGGLFDSYLESTNALLVKVRSNSVQKLAPLKLGRSFHAMTWLENKPAVLGGFSQTSLASVEVYENERWVETPFLNTARHGLAACCTQDASYVIGGLHTCSVEAGIEHLGVDTIERFRSGSWEVLPVRLPFDSQEFCDELGALALDDARLLILGGCEDKLLGIECNLDSGTVKFAASFIRSAKLPWNLWVKTSNEFVGFDSAGDLFSFKP